MCMWLYGKIFMPKVIPTKISKSERETLKKLLSKKIAKLKTERDVINFLEDILTESEFIMIIRRLEIAKMLLDNKTYFEIVNELRVSHQTIKFVREKINSGRGGFLKFIKELKV